MALTHKQKLWIDVVQWALIAVLLGICCVVFIGNKNLKHERDIAKEELYIKIYQSQTIEELKKKNKELYDSVMSINNGKDAESALQILYKYKYKTDTITKTEFVLSEDSVYHYVSDNDTIKTEIDVKAKDLAWVKSNTEIRDKFTIINRTDGKGNNETTINHSANVEIEKVDAWRRKTSWKDRISAGPSIGAGYGVFNNKFDVFIGFSVSYKIN